MPTKYGHVVGGALNLRELPSIAGNRLTLIPNETTLLVADYNEDWYATTYGDLSGYVLKRYVQLLNMGMDSVLTGSVIGNCLPLQPNASNRMGCLILIPNETLLEAVDYDAESDWYLTSYGGYAGYVMKQFVEILEPPPVTEWLFGQVTSSSLNVRKQPSLSAPLWNNTWPLNRIALVKPSLDGWYETLYRGEQAFVSARYIELLPDPVPDSLVERMMFIAEPELGRANSVYFNGYGGKWCHRFADWLAMHAGTPKERIPNTGNCGWGIVWFVRNQRFCFKNEKHKIRMVRAYPEIRSISAELSGDEKAYYPSPGNYVYFRWSNAQPAVNVSHVGIVRSAHENILTTFEGNVGQKVVSRTFQLDDDRIVGYGSPIFS